MKGPSRGAYAVARARSHTHVACLRGGVHGVCVCVSARANTHWSCEHGAPVRSARRSLPISSVAVADTPQAPPAAGMTRTGWLLAGGLDPDNVRAAVCAAAPSGVDVASGTADASGVAKDHAKVAAFVANARMAATECC